MWVRPGNHSENKLIKLDLNILLRVFNRYREDYWFMSIFLLVSTISFDIPFIFNK